MMTAIGLLLVLLTGPTEAPTLIRSAQSGPWSEPATWEGGKVPGQGDRVQVRGGHRVVYDRDHDATIRSIHVAGILEFARDRDTRLDVGLIKIQAGDDASEDGFGCDAHPATGPEGQGRPALLVGLAHEPIPADKSATIRLTYIEGMDRETCPAIISCGGQVEFHGAELSRTWTKLAREAYRGETVVLLPRADVQGWKPGDRVILTGTTRQFGYKDTRTTSVAERPATEERLIKQIRDYRDDREELVRLTLDRPLDHDHRAQDDYRAEVANLSRNVVVESTDPAGVRGHTMFHRGSAASIAYAEFRHLGKKGVLGKYAMHFHLAGESMRGSSIIGASIWDSENRWITIHGTSYLVVRDCVGYKSIGHGFFLEDGTETRNVFDRNLAVMALRGEPLPDQVLPFDGNLGSGFWWSNSLNTFTNNVAAECDQDGYRFEVVASDKFDPVKLVLQPDGKKREVDIRTLPFIRFEGNEAHCQRFFGLNLGGFNSGVVPGYAVKELVIEDVDGVGPDKRHPFLIRDFRAWNTHWAFHAGSPCVRADGLDLYDSEYALWRCVIDRHEYSDLKIGRITQMAMFFPRPGRSTPADGVVNLSPVDDLPPSTVVTQIVPLDSSGRVLVRGTASDDYEIRRVLVNGREATATRPNFAEWRIELDADASGNLEIVAGAEDAKGNVEPTPHKLSKAADSLPMAGLPRASAAAPVPHVATESGGN